MKNITVIQKLSLCLCFETKKGVIMGMETLDMTDTRDLIRAYIKKDSRNLPWLSKQTNINYSTMYSIFVQKTIKLSEKNLDKINKTLKTDFKL